VLSRVLPTKEDSKAGAIDANVVVGFCVGGPDEFCPMAALWLPGGVDIKYLAAYNPGSSLEPTFRLEPPVSKGR
jgi:hypothetical protein